MDVIAESCPPKLPVVRTSRRAQTMICFPVSGHTMLQGIQGNKPVDVLPSSAVRTRRSLGSFDLSDPSSMLKSSAEVAAGSRRRSMRRTSSESVFVSFDESQGMKSPSLPRIKRNSVRHTETQLSPEKSCALRGRSYSRESSRHMVTLSFEGLLVNFFPVYEHDQEALWQESSVCQVLDVCRDYLDLIEDRDFVEIAYFRQRWSNEMTGTCTALTREGLFKTTLLSRNPLSREFHQWCLNVMQKISHLSIQLHQEERSFTLDEGRVEDEEEGEKDNKPKDKQKDKLKDKDKTQLLLPIKIPPRPRETGSDAPTDMIFEETQTSKGWRHLSTDAEGMTLFQKVDPSTRATSGKATCRILASPSSVFQLIWNLRLWSSWNSEATIVQTVKNVSRHDKLLYSIVPLEQPINGKVHYDISATISWKQANVFNATFISVVSQVHPDLPVNNDYIRGEWNWGFYIVPDKQNPTAACEVTFVVMHVKPEDTPWSQTVDCDKCLDRLQLLAGIRAKAEADAHHRTNPSS
eukprot:GILJ01020042.1.p1 GENE.GILJ01020042.1~~GILJ01020042.1.p1  ORF type:complete len:521 (-),score=57.73 GILJ01020042.1:185-1747(-)